MRRASREYVFKLVFEFTFYGSANEETLDLFLTDADLNDEDKEYIRECYYGVSKAGFPPGALHGGQALPPRHGGAAHRAL